MDFTMLKRLVIFFNHHGDARWIMIGKIETIPAGIGFDPLKVIRWYVCDDGVSGGRRSVAVFDGGGRGWADRHI